MNGQEPRDVIDFQRLSDASDLSVLVRRAGAPLPRLVRVDKEAGEPLGVEVSSAVFDRIRTCDNHCAFCFIYQLPKGMRRSLYLKDDDYRLSFLYGNFTTLTRFTELDAERILTERLGPLFVSIHTTDPELRAHMLRNPKGATSLRWLQVLLDGGIEVHGQVVVCPGVNDGAALEDTLAGILDRYPGLASVGAVPLGAQPLLQRARDASAHDRRRPGASSTRSTSGSGLFRKALGHRMVFAADEYYLLAGRDLPRRGHYDGLPPARERDRHGPRLRRFVRPTRGRRPGRRAPRLLRLGRRGAGRGLPGAAPADGRARREPTAAPSPCSPAPTAPACWARCWRRTPRDDVELRAVRQRLLRRQHRCGRPPDRRGPRPRPRQSVPDGSRCLLPDACLNEGRFLDGLTLADLPRPVEVVPTEGASLRLALDGTSLPTGCARHEPRWSSWPAGPTSASPPW